jgi:hypothetical protein
LPSSVAVALTLYPFSKIMIEKQSIKGKDVWVKVDPYRLERSNRNIIPTEYFTATYYLDDPLAAKDGEVIYDEEGEVKLFESPVAALSFVTKRLQAVL